MLFPEPTEQEKENIFLEYRSLLRRMADSFRAVSEYERQMRAVLGVNWESQYEDYIDAHEDLKRDRILWY